MSSPLCNANLGPTRTAVQNRRKRLQRLSVGASEFAQRGEAPHFAGSGGEMPTV